MASSGVCPIPSEYHFPCLLIGFVVSFVVLLPPSFLFAPFLLFALLSLVTTYIYSKYFVNSKATYGEWRRLLWPPSHPHTLSVLSQYSVNHFEEYVNRPVDGALLYTHILAPKSINSAKSILLICHGYCDHTNDLMFEICAKLVSTGKYIVIMFDQYGHGKSDGLHAYIPQWTQLVDDAHFVSTHCLSKIKNQLGLKQDLPLFLYGESMGGAVALQFSLRYPDYPIRGLVISAPMCKINENMKPHPAAISFLSQLAHIFPSLPITPIPYMLKWCFRDPNILIRAEKSPFLWNKKARLMTALQMYYLSLETQGRLNEIVQPFVVLQGSGDRVTDPAGSAALYESAKSADKQYKQYPGAWHSLLVGEPPDSKERILADVIEWIDKRAAR